MCCITDYRRTHVSIIQICLNGFVKFAGTEFMTYTPPTDKERKVDVEMRIMSGTDCIEANTIMTLKVNEAWRIQRGVVGRALFLNRAKNFMIIPINMSTFTPPLF